MPQKTGYTRQQPQSTVSPYKMRTSVNGGVLANRSTNAHTVQDPTLYSGVSKGIIQKVYTPVKLTSMQQWLKIYPDQETAKFLIEGFSKGFPLPVFQGGGCELVKNLKSVSNYAHIVKKKLVKEIKEGRIAGPFSQLVPPFDILGYLRDHTQKGAKFFLPNTPPIIP